MATAAQIQQFVQQMSPFAAQASQATGLNETLILAQWGNEVNWGTQYAQANNIGNVGVYSGGPNPSYPTLAAGVQAYINEMNSPALAGAKSQWQGKTADQQAAIIGGSGYAGGGYNNGGGPGSSLVADMSEVTGSGAAPSGMSQADWTALSAAAAEPGGAAYLTAMAAQNQYVAAATTPPATGATAANTGNSPSVAESTTIAGIAQPFVTPAQDVANNSQAALSGQISAIAQLNATLVGYGFSTADANSLTEWAWGEITNNVDPTQVALDIQTPGSTAYPIFEKQFPGFVAANTQLNAQGLAAVSVSQYQSYQTQAMAMAQAAGLPPGFITSQDIGTLVGNNVSTQELSSRLNNATALAINSTPEQQRMFNQYFGAQYGNDQNISGGTIGTTGTAIGPNGEWTGGGLSTGQIAAIALDPAKAEPLIAQQITTAQIGGASVTSGVGALDVGTATQLAQAGITEAQATSAFQNLAPFAPLETARPGQGLVTQGVVSPEQLATGALLGNTAAQRQLQTAEEVAKAPFSGGGGFVSNAKGVAGTGSASSSGAGT